MAMDKIITIDFPRVLFCIDTLNGGGAEKLLIRYVNVLNKNREINITLLVLRRYGELLSEVQSDVAIYFYSDMTPDEREKFNKLEFDVEIAFLESFASRFIANKVSKAFKVGWIHTDLLNNNWCVRCFPDGRQEEIYNMLDNIVCINRYCKDCFIKAFPSLEDKTITCNNILDFESMDMAILTNTPNKVPTFSFVGRLVREKHPELALLAFIELLNKGIICKLKFIGEGNLGQSLLEFCRLHRLSDYVNFCGYLSSPYNEMAQSTAILSLSDIEGGPLTIAEAYYMGIPSISTHSGGADSFMKLYGGVIMTERNSKALANIMEELMDSDFHKSIKVQINPNAVRKDFSESNFLELIDFWISNAKYKHG